MKAVILAGGHGTRISEESSVRPKPMVEIGGKPVLWHIMKLYSHHGFTDFVLCLGIKGNVIRDYFLDYVAMNSDVRMPYTRRMKMSRPRPGSRPNQCSPEMPPR